VEEGLIWCRLIRDDLEEGLIWCRLTWDDLLEGTLNQFVCCRCFFAAMAVLCEYRSVYRVVLRIWLFVAVLVCQSVLRSSYTARARSVPALTFASILRCTVSVTHTSVLRHTCCRAAAFTVRFHLVFRHTVRYPLLHVYSCTTTYRCTV